MPWFLTEIFVFWNTFWCVHVQVLHTMEDSDLWMVRISGSKRNNQTDSIFLCRFDSGHVMDQFWSLSKNTFSHFFVGNCEQVLRFIGFINNHINRFLLWMTDQFESSTLKIKFRDDDQVSQVVLRSPGEVVIASDQNKLEKSIEFSGRQ